MLRDVTSWLLPIATCCAVLAGCDRKAPADLVIHGKVATVDASFSIREAVAVRDGVIVYVGDRMGVGRDLLSTPPRDIPRTRVLFTVVGGTVVYRTEGRRRPAWRP
jgi:predicted amidohydrolase YtcJ